MGALQELGISERRACELVTIGRSTFRYQSQEPEDGELRARIKELAERNRRYGYRRIHVLLQREKLEANHKKVYRIYREEGLAIRKRRRKKLLVQRNPAVIAEYPNQVWCMDFIFDTTEVGRHLKLFIVLD